MSHAAVTSARTTPHPFPVLALLLLGGCIGERVVYPVEPTPEELAAFLAAGPPELDLDGPAGEAMRVSGPYHLVAGDLLKIQVPPEAQGPAVEPTSATAIEFHCRVEPGGVIQVPWIGTLPVAGNTCTDVEEQLGQAYERSDRLGRRPGVVVTVEEYETVQVAVIGTVLQPGLHDLRSDHRTVMGALMAAGGIKAERGAGRIRVVSQDAQGQTVTRELQVLLDNIPLADIALEGGETVVVEPALERQFAVIGLVRKSGVFSYPAQRRYNLMQALALAGGVDSNAAPRYATVYRKRMDGSLLGATFKIDGTSLTDASNIAIKDGDVIAVEHTQGSWTRQFLSQVFGFRANVSVTSTASPTL